MAEYAAPDPLPEGPPPTVLGTPDPDAPQLGLHVIDVGQGDALLVTTAGGRTVLLDAGPEGGAGALARALARAGVKRIDVFVATHRHDDHIGGLPRLVARFPPAVIVDTEFAVAGPLAREYQRTLERLGAPVVRAERGLVVAGRGQALWVCPAPSSEARAPSMLVVDAAGASERALPPGAKCVDALGPAAEAAEPTMELDFLLPEQPFIAGSRSDANANSTIVRLEYGAICAILAADAEADTERRLLESHPPARLTCPLLKVAHHGSRYSSTDAFLDAVSPTVALIPAGRFNRHGHPSPSTVRKLFRRSVRTYRTDKMGTLRVHTDGQRVAVEIERTPAYWKRKLR